MTGFDLLLTLVAIVAGAIASVAGFGVGSLLTPLFATQVGMKVAVAAVAIPHVLGTAFRMWTLRRDLDRHVLLTFGVTSAIGGLAGALLHSVLAGRALSWILAALLIFAGIVSVAGIQLRFSRRGAYVAGAVSGMLGGLVGNQGGIRAGAMLGFDVKKEAFVATATAVALIVDAARLPVYLLAEGRALTPLWPLIAIATVGVIVGTIVGRIALRRMNEQLFRRVVGLLLIALGVWVAYS